MKIIITGSAGFIGFTLAKRLLEDNLDIFGIDNHSAYYDVQLKESRVSKLEQYKKYKHFKCDITDMASMVEIFDQIKPDILIHLAAQPGVRYSLQNPQSYVDSNLIGFSNILELSKIYSVKHLIFASSSSVYGGNDAIPFSENDFVDKPLNLYAATKKSNELMSYAYSSLFQIPSTGLRFFTVYGPWGRPDMAPMIILESILSNKRIKIHNNGNHSRDFTFVEDIVDGLIRVLDNPPKVNSISEVYNIGSGIPIQLMDFIEAIEKAVGMKAKKEFIGLQPGEMIETYADMGKFNDAFGKIEVTDFNHGIQRFVDWYLNFYKV